MKQKQKIREQFRNSVFKRDGYKCVFCDSKDNLDAHHITDRNLLPNGGYVLENGITLCPKHHLLAEEFHQGKTVSGWHPDDLYKKINSSFELAYEKSNS